MKALKLLILPAAFGLMFLAVSSAEAHFSSNKKQAKSFRSWTITMSKSGGFAGIMKSCTLDSLGNLTHRDRAGINTEKISGEVVGEIERIIQKLKLPNTKTKMVKGKRIYDGIYSSFVITLDGKDYRVEGSSFDDAKRLALTVRQKEILETLYKKLKNLGAVIA